MSLVDKQNIEVDIINESTNDVIGGLVLSPKSTGTN